MQTFLIEEIYLNKYYALYFDTKYKVNQLTLTNEKLKLILFEK